MKKSNNRFLRLVNSPFVWIAISCLIATFLYANRFLIPDMSTDSISYHLFNGSRSLTHPFTPFSNSEFYPVGIANIPAGIDGLVAITRGLLGYRLGTILSLLSLLVMAFVMYLLLDIVLRERRRKFNAFWGILLVSSLVVLELYFQIATYFVDNINAVILIGLFYGVLRLIIKPPKRNLNYLYGGLYLALGFMVAFKLTNLPFVLPLALLLIYEQYKYLAKLPITFKRLLPQLALVTLIALPIIPLWAQNYQQSHNPVFPFYNTVFKSPYYPNTNFTDTNFGAQTVTQRLLWPILSLRNQVRLGEPHHIYNDYKLAIYWAAAAALAVLYLLRLIKLNRQERIIIGYFLSSLFFWGALFGINRYATSSITLGGIIVVIACMQVPPKGALRAPVIVILALLLLFLGRENYRIIQFNIKYDMSWRPGLNLNHQLHKSQASHLFDKHISVSNEQQKVIDKADITLNCSTNVSGLITLLPGANNKPMVNIISEGLPHYQVMSENAAYRKKVRSRLPAKDRLTFVSIVSAKDIGPTDKNCMANIRRFGGSVGEWQPLESFLGYKGPELTLISGTIPL